jgi:hypothetical protein
MKRMNKLKMVAPALGALLLVLSLTADTLAGSCQTKPRNFPTSGSDRVALKCRHGSAAQVKGTLTATAAGKSLTASLDQGVVGETATVQGLDQNGSVIAGCTKTDTTILGSAASVTCAAAVKWRAIVSFIE